MLFFDERTSRSEDPQKIQTLKVLQEQKEGNYYNFLQDKRDLFVKKEDIINFLPEKLRDKTIQSPLKEFLIQLKGTNILLAELQSYLNNEKYKEIDAEIQEFLDKETENFISKHLFRDPSDYGSIISENNHIYFLVYVIKKTYSPALFNAIFEDLSQNQEIRTNLLKQQKSWDTFQGQLKKIWQILINDTHYTQANYTSWQGKSLEYDQLLIFLNALCDKDQYNIFTQYLIDITRRHIIRKINSCTHESEVLILKYNINSNGLLDKLKCIPNPSDPITPLQDEFNKIFTEKLSSYTPTRSFKFNTLWNPQPIEDQDSEFGCSHIKNEDL